MGMPRGLAKATNYYNRIEAVRDWNRLAAEVLKTDKFALAWKHKPADNAGWRKIDKCIAALRAELEQPAPGGDA